MLVFGDNPHGNAAKVSETKFAAKEALTDHHS